MTDPRGQNEASVHERIALAQDALAYADNIIATLREPFLVLDKKLRIVTANRSFYENFHVTPEETQGCFIYDLGNRQWDIPKLRTLLEDVLHKNQAFVDFEVEHDFRTIGRKVMLLNARRIRKPGNCSELILLAIDDISQRQETDTQKFRLAAIVESSDDAIISKDLNGIILTWNQGAERLFGYTPQEAIEQPITMIIPADRLDEEPEILKRIRHGEHIEHYDTVRRRKDGSLVDISLTVSPIINAHGQIVAASKIARDISERRRWEDALAFSEIKYRRLFEAAQDAILILNATTGKITDANPFIQDLLGYSHAEFLGKELWELGIFEDKEAIRSAFQRLQKEGYIRFDHLPLETKSGKKVEVEFVSNSYQVDHKPVIQCNIRDMTDRARLERKTHEQTEALADLHRRKDEFLAMLSHELRNPLAPISNALMLLRPLSSENPMLQRSRTIIERQVGQLTRLIDDLLEVSRITMGRIHLLQEHLDLRGVVENAVETVRPLIASHAHTLDVRLPPEPIWVQGDAARLEQVVVNLLNNAAKYSKDQGHIFVNLELGGTALPGPGDVNALDAAGKAVAQSTEAVLRIRDEGIGISPEVLPRIFDLFTQAERSLDRAQGGLGIGLALVRQLVEMHSGSVEVHSSLGRGSEFIVHLPCATPRRYSDEVCPTHPAHPDGVPSECGTQAASGTPSPESLRVLVVDDNKDAAESMAMLLQSSGHQVRTAHDGPTALTTALEYRPDVALMDIGLPKMDGYEVAKKMRAQPSLKNLVLVAMTGYGQDSDRQRSREAGINQHLVKPVDFDKVQQILAIVSSQKAK